LDSLEDNFLYTLMGKYNLMLYPYITLILIRDVQLDPSPIFHPWHPWGQT